MSDKYVPSFLQQPQTSQNTGSIWPSQKRDIQFNTTNKFSALNGDFPMNKKEKEKPHVVPATLASLTSNNSRPLANSTRGDKKTFASSFAEQIKNADTPKPINVQSQDDFPTLGAPKKPITSVVEAKPAGNKWASMASDWAKQKEEEAEEARRKLIEEENQRGELQLLKNIASITIRRRQAKYEEEEDDEKTSLEEDENSYEVSEEEEEEEEENAEEEDEFNQTVGWDGRRRDDLY
jgi:hypothetical protein